MASKPIRNQPKARDNLNSSLSPGGVVDVGYVDINDNAKDFNTKNSQSDYTEIPLPEGAAVDATATVAHKSTTQTTSKHLGTPSPTSKKIVDVGYVHIFNGVQQDNGVGSKSKNRNLDYQDIGIGIPTIIISECPEGQEPETNCEIQSNLASQPIVVDVGYVQIFNETKKCSSDDAKNAQDLKMDLEYTELPTPAPVSSHMRVNSKKFKPKCGSKSSGPVVDVGYVQIFRATNEKNVKHNHQNLALDLDFDPDYAELPIPATPSAQTTAENPNEPAVLPVESQMMQSGSGSGFGSGSGSTPSCKMDRSTTCLKDDTNLNQRISEVNLDDVQLRFKPQNTGNDISYNEHGSESVNGDGCCRSCCNFCLGCAFLSCVGCIGYVGILCGCCCSKCDR